jgi:hypothetical protein
MEKILEHKNIFWKPFFGCKQIGERKIPKKEKNARKQIVQEYVLDKNFAEKSLCANWSS